MLSFYYYFEGPKIAMACSALKMLVILLSTQRAVLQILLLFLCSTVLVNVVLLSVVFSTVTVVLPHLGSIEC